RPAPRARSSAGRSRSARDAAADPPQSTVRPRVSGSRWSSSWQWSFPERVACNVRERSLTLSIVNSSTSIRTPARRTRRPAAETRQHILDVAEELFYWQGIHATGIDRIVVEAEVAPTTLYRLFGSKDDLVAAYVDRYAEGYRAWIESITSDPELPARERILALFDAVSANTGPGT